MLAVVMDEVTPTDMVVGELLRTRASAMPDRPFLHFAGDPEAATSGTATSGTATSGTATSAPSRPPPTGTPPRCTRSGCVPASRSP